MIGTPAYNCQIHTDYLMSVLGFVQAGIKFSVMTVGNESLITRARNALISKFYQTTGYSHLLFLDGDVHLNGSDLAKLIDRDKDVIGAPVPLKKLDQAGKKLFNLGRLLERGIDGDEKLCLTDYIGTAVLLLSRKSIDALVEDAKNEQRVYNINQRSTTDENPGDQFDIFQVGVKNKIYLSEDYWVCDRLRFLGFDVHVDVSILVQHNGMHQF